MRKHFLCIALVLMSGTSVCWGQGVRDSSSGQGFRSSGYVYFQNYRLGQATYQGENYRGDDYTSVLGGFVLDNSMSERLKTRVTVEATSEYGTFPTSLGQNQTGLGTVHNGASLSEAKAIYYWGNVQKPPFELEVGYFIYDYNKDQHNLGEYLFRSRIYPTILTTDFDFPEDRLLGIRLGNNQPFPGFHQDLLLTNDYQYYPKSSFTLSYLADYSLGKVLQVGLGASFVDLIPVQPSKESPNTGTLGVENSYTQIPVQNWKDANGVQHQITSPVDYYGDAIPQALADSNGNLNAGIKETTTNYTYQGVALMGRFTFDPKPLMGFPSWLPSWLGLGKEDLKIYSEAAVLGVKDYPGVYNDIWQRIPVMVGFDFPGFRIIDVIGLEVEYCGNNYQDDWERSVNDEVPEPGPLGLYPNNPGTQDPNNHWKWSIYLREQVSRGLSISAQLASDHLRLTEPVNNTAYAENMVDTPGPFSFSGDWWGIIRVTANY